MTKKNKPNFINYEAFKIQHELGTLIKIIKIIGWHSPNRQFCQINWNSKYFPWKFSD